MQNLLLGMAEQCIYSEAQLPLSPMTFNTRDLHFKCVICYLKKKQGHYLLLLNLMVCHSFKINEEKVQIQHNNTQTKLNANETVEHFLRAESCQICSHRYCKYHFKYLKVLNKKKHEKLIRKNF